MSITDAELNWLERMSENTASGDIAVRAVAWLRAQRVEADRLRAELTAAEATVAAMRPVVEATLAERAAWDERERMEGQGFRSSSRDNAVAAAANALDAAIDTYRAPPHGKDGEG